VFALLPPACHLVFVLPATARRVVFFFFFCAFCASAVSVLLVAAACLPAPPIWQWLVFCCEFCAFRTPAVFRLLVAAAYWQQFVVFVGDLLCTGGHGARCTPGISRLLILAGFRPRHIRRFRFERHGIVDPPGLIGGNT
jgi:hypothetical protein